MVEIVYADVDPVLWGAAELSVRAQLAHLAHPRLNRFRDPAQMWRSRGVRCCAVRDEGRWTAATSSFSSSCAWGGGFLWFVAGRHLRDLPFAAEQVATASARCSSPLKRGLEPRRLRRVSAETPPRPGSLPSATAYARASVTLAQERTSAAVDINPAPEAPPAPIPLPPVADWRMASFNVLGSSHTGGGGQGRRDGQSDRSACGGALAILTATPVSVVGFQEMQGNQRGAFQQRAPGWALYPGDAGSATPARTPSAGTPTSGSW